MFKYITAGESHGPEVTAVVKSLPAGLKIDIEKINDELFRRQQGYGRGGRMKIESDKVNITSGLRSGLTLGTPLTMRIENKDWKNWQKVMSPDGSNEDAERLTNPRPGHADLPGALKYNFKDLRNVLERASARETAARTAVGAVAKQFLQEMNIKIYSHVVQIGNIVSDSWAEIEKKEKFKMELSEDNSNSSAEKIKKYFQKVEKSPLRCGSENKTEEMIELINAWRAEGDSVGGVFEIIIRNMPVGVGSHVHWDYKLDSKLAGALMSIQAIKGVEIGAGFTAAASPGSKVHDEIFYNREKGFYRNTNNAGGLEGGISNGEEIVLRLAMKPIPTLAKPLHTADLITKEERQAAKERSDVCAVPSASVVGEAVSAAVIAESICKKFGGDSMEEIKRNYNSYLEYLKDI
ncbi:MAG: chorismate synthase [Bacillota bacterium]